MRTSRSWRWILAAGLTAACLRPAFSQTPVFAGAKGALGRPAAEVYDGNTRRGQPAASFAAEPVYAGAAAPAREAAALTDVPAIPRSREIPGPRPAAGQVSCEQALAHYPTAAGLCGSHPTMAPLLAGLMDAFRQQFGTAEGIASNLLWMLISLLMTAISGFGAVAQIAISVVSLGLSAWMIWPLVKQGYTAVQGLRRSHPGSQEHYASLFSLGVVGGTLLILALMTAAGWAIGKSSAGNRALSSLDGMLEAGAQRLGLPHTATAEAPGGTMAGIFGTVAEPVGLRSGHALTRGAQLGAGFQTGHGHSGLEDAHIP